MLHILNRAHLLHFTFSEIRYIHAVLFSNTNNSFSFLQKYNKGLPYCVTTLSLSTPGIKKKKRMTDGQTDRGTEKWEYKGGSILVSHARLTSSQQWIHGNKINNVIQLWSEDANVDINIYSTFHLLCACAYVHAHTHTHKCTHTHTHTHTRTHYKHIQPSCHSPALPGLLN